MTVDFKVGNCIQKTRGGGYSRRNGYAKNSTTSDGQIVRIDGEIPVVSWYRQEEKRWTSPRKYLDDFKVLKHQTQVDRFEKGCWVGWTKIDTPIPFVA